MKIESQTPGKENIYIKKYVPGESISLLGKEYYSSLVIKNNKVLFPNWDCKSVFSINERDINLILEEDSEIYILGTGDIFLMPPKKVFSFFARAGKSLDCMKSHSACTTFNLLSLENRKVAAAIIL